MTVVIDQSLCTGCGICSEACPEVFALGADGTAYTIAQACGTHNLEEIADSCPVEAISIS